MCVAKASKHHVGVDYSLAAGFGIWATHFIAMLAYNGIGVACDINLTTLSLFMAVAVICVGLCVAIYIPARWAAPAGGGIFGTGVALMHYLGMIGNSQSHHLVPGIGSGFDRVPECYSGLLHSLSQRVAIPFSIRPVAALLLTLAIVFASFYRNGRS